MESGISRRKIGKTGPDYSAISQASGDITGSRGMCERESAKRFSKMERGKAAGSEEHANYDGRPTYQTLSAMYERMGGHSHRSQAGRNRI